MTKEAVGRKGLSVGRELDGVVDHSTLPCDEAGWLRNKSAPPRWAFGGALRGETAAPIFLAALCMTACSTLVFCNDHGRFVDDESWGHRRGGRH
ncbi:hypothetical protein ACGFZJ_41455 [Streptomyces sp. NPDC048253]|uniref:hypothetical protein n=1 Tax=Streptomyces sp. NPDC048253 TaxID=3365524 RepID=UPI003724065D